ncbi:MAG: hypothetical protein AB7T07_09830 [Steroidobacteraceae bacterium]
MQQHHASAITQYMIDSYASDFSNALRQAGDELGLPDYYQPCVRPLFNMPVQQWPMCCGGRCDPCAQKLTAVACRVCELLQIEKDKLGT